MIPFELVAVDSLTKARAGAITTSHGIIETPVFMPVGTQASVKTLSPEDLNGAGAQIILGNTYYIYLRPGGEIISQAQGLHRFMAWEKPILTDSGGFQVFSLSEFNKINDDGVTFQSHYDGSYHKFTPEKVIELQRAFGVDIMMPLDYPIEYPSGQENARRAMKITHRWAEESIDAFRNSLERYGSPQYLFGIVQGGTFEDLRKESVRALMDMPFDGYAIGGLSVGEPKRDMYELTGLCAENLPHGLPRYLMGVGKPLDIIESIALGVDMFDCVIPTRNARNGTLYTAKGKVVIRNSRYRDDFTPVDEECPCYTCRTFSKAYLRHLFQAKEILGLRLASLHNVHFFVNLAKEARASICAGSFGELRDRYRGIYGEEKADE